MRRSSSWGRTCRRLKKRSRNISGRSTPSPAPPARTPCTWRSLASGIKAGDEVITTPFTFIATAEAISYIGAKPVFADIAPDTWNIDPEEIKKKITSRTKAVIPVHLFGHPAEMGSILEIANAHGLKVIEDCAQSFGAGYKFVRTGSFADAGCFSFFPSKNLGCYGDGGMVTTDSDNIAGELRALRNHGSKTRYYHDTVGYNSRLDEIQAAILRVKLPKIDRYNSLRRERAAQYNELLATQDGIDLPVEKNGYYHVYHQYTILADRRDEILRTPWRKRISRPLYIIPSRSTCRNPTAAWDIKKATSRSRKTSQSAFCPCRFTRNLNRRTSI